MRRLGEAITLGTGGAHEGRPQKLTTELHGTNAHPAMSVPRRRAVAKGRPAAAIQPKNTGAAASVFAQAIEQASTFAINHPFTTAVQIPLGNDFL
jgi:hypothetical protein